MKNKIDYRFKILYALGIIMVLLGHTWGEGISIVSDWFPYGGLHLPMFVFCSGYFYNPSSEKNVVAYIVKKIKTLIIPLYVYTIVYGIIVQISRLKGFTIGGDFNLTNIVLMPIINGHQFGYNLAGWFVVPLFMVELYNIIIRKLLGMKFLRGGGVEGVYFIFNIMVGLVGNTLACNGYYYNWWLVLVRALYFVPFYGMGVFYKSTLEKYEKKIPGIWYFSFIFLSKLIVVGIYKEMPTYRPSWCDDFTEGPLLPIIVGYLGIAFWLRIATIIEPVIGRNKYINLIADNTYSIMMNHLMGFMLLKTVYALLNKFTPYCKEFDWGSYKTSIFWYYKPYNLPHMAILYIVIGIIFPIVIQHIIDIFKNIGMIFFEKMEGYT